MLLSAGIKVEKNVSEKKEIIRMVTESGRRAPDRIKSSNNQKLKRLDLKLLVSSYFVFCMLAK